MSKGTRWIKRVTALLLVLLLSIESFAAVVSDNDGSAFITKAEFDSLKNNFQSQINKYNTSIDSKIDGAIAAYLAGIRIDNWMSQNMIGYQGKKGILSVAGRSDMKWQNGRMYGTMIQFTSRQRDVAVARVGTLKLTGVTEKSVGENNPFWELGVKDVEYDLGQAGWQGYSRCVNSFYLIRAGLAPVTTTSYMTWPDSVCNAWYVHRGNGGYPLSNVDLGVKAMGAVESADSLMHFGQAYTETGAYYNAFVIRRGGAFLNRNVKETKLEHIILTPSEKKENRFSNMDEIRDWYNDDIDGTFNKVSDHGTGASGFIRSLCDSYDCDLVRFDSASSTKATAYKPTVQAQTAGGSGASQVNVYLGFVKSLTDYNKLWTSDYDSYIDDMLTYDSNMDYAIYTNPNTGEKTKHLWISAGLPISKVERNNNVKIKLDFKQEDTNGDGVVDSKDELQNYNVWFKWGAFKNKTDPKDDKVINKDVKLNNGKIASYSELNKCWVIKNGDTAIVPKNDSTGYLFMKWSMENTTSGGGTFIGTDQIQVQKAD